MFLGLGKGTWAVYVRGTFGRVNPGLRPQVPLKQVPWEFEQRTLANE
jgi:hypothetical protein